MSQVTIDPRTIRWIAFDAVDTLIKPTPSVAAVYHEIGRRHGSRLPLEEVASRFRKAFSHTDEPGTLSCDCAASHDAWHTCESREGLRWRIIVERVLSDAVSAKPCFDELFAHFGRPSSWSCFPEVESTLATLRKADVRLAVASNFDARLNTVLDGLPALRPIELRVISSEVGHRKPSGRFFQALLSRTGCDPAELLFVGDNPRTDVAAANARGIPGLQIDRTAAKAENHRLIRSLTDLIGLLERSKVQGPKSKL